MEGKKNQVIYTCFPKGKHKVLTMSFDDGRVQDRQLIELFHTYGIRGTFNLNSGIHKDNLIPQEEYAALYKDHEIACHTVNHPTLSRCPMQNVVKEILEDRASLEKITGRIVTGLAYPNGVYTPDIMNLLPALGIQYARTVTSTHDFAMPTNWFEWNPTCHFREDLCETGEKFLELHKKQYLFMMYVWGHSYELEIPGAYQKLEKFCRDIGGQEDIWYAANGEIVEYMNQASRLQYSADNSKVYNPGCMTIWISVDGEIKEIPGGRVVSISSEENRNCNLTRNR